MSGDGGQEVSARHQVAFARLARWGRPLAVLVTTLVVVGTLFTFVFPTRTLLQQRHAIAAAEQQVSQNKANTSALQARRDELHTDAEIEALARGQYGLVKPGEVPFAILPGPGAQSALGPAPTPAGGSSEPATATSKSWWRRAIDAIIR